MEYDEYYDLFVEDGEEEIELELDDTEVKPEQIIDIVPAYEPQIVYPAPGMTIGQANVAAIPDPTAVKDISENGDHNVARYGTARVHVQPNLQTPDPITPTKSQQTVTPSAGYDGLAQAVVEPIPSEYIVPSGKITLTENDTDVDISQYEAADIAVPVPVMPEEYAIGGSLADDTATGYYIKRGAKKIKTYMFEASSSLTDVDIPDSVEMIENYAFHNLVKDIEIKLPSNLKTIGQGAFQGSTKLTLTNGLPDGVISIGGSAFNNCPKINFDKLPDTVTSLSAYAFYGCTGLLMTKLSESLTAIGSNCFANSAVQITEIPAGVLTIGVFAFFNCRNLTTITFKGTPNSIAANAFSAGSTGSTVTDVYVPWAEGEVANAPWGATNATIHYNYTGGD